MDKKPFEQWHDAKYPDTHERARRSWELAAVRAHKRWGQGREVAEAEYDEALAEVLNLPIGGTGTPPESQE